MEWQLLTVLQEWHIALDNHLHVRTVFLDAAKAFDRVDHTVLLSRLSGIGMLDSALAWFRSYLTGRRIRTHVDGALSGELEITSGVPQGSVLGPLLYLLHAKISSVTKAGCALFADNTMLYRRGCVADRLLPCCPLKGDLENMSDWAKVSSVTFNATKSAAMLLGGKSRGDPLQPQYLNEVPVPFKSTQRHLGVVLSNNLRWDDHVYCML